ncbi:hypothetical protein GUJ93_ZPchr0010g10899 [Zizania palustris]|uniref:Uncharacterized protein n=1 Tax=Zizania palustris TaxID=103762 RepID=A0A8J5W9G9_ZIZPA|nr:hypothetical protein GUJ93_ZPchr0010g10899 [Zizania palustris]
MSAAVGGAEFHGFRGAAQLPRSRMLGRPLRVAPPPATPSGGAGGPSAASIRAVSAPLKKDASEVKRSKVEIIKEKSNFLRYPLNEELVSEAPNINDNAVQLIKFHGSYQQTDRDVRGQKNYSFMLRTKNPCGKVPNQLYLAMDTLADEFGIGTLRLTTRQTFQLHGVIKKNLKTVIGTVIKNMGSTLGACGDLNRNVLAPAAPYVRKDILFAQETAENIAVLLTPQSGAYYDLWVDGEKIMSAEEPPEVTKARDDNTHGTNFPDSPEPIYGTQYLPRKFKIAVTVAGDNSVDILTNDIGVVVVSDSEGEPAGFNIYVGGGMGRTHRVETTFPDWLIHWVMFLRKIYFEKYYGKKFEDSHPLPQWQFNSYLGWQEQGDGKLFYGVHIDNGRVGGQAKKTLREIIEKYNLDVSITPNQNLILCGINQAWKDPITAALAQAGLLDPKDVDPLNLTSMACPALPLCPLAQTEAERGILPILKRIRAVFDKVGIKDHESVVVRITGCPNGCARPYMAEVGFVGDGPNSYQIWLGGTPNQSTLAESFMNKVKLQDIEKVLEPLFSYWNSARQDGESFGTFTCRTGFDKLKEVVDKWGESASAT